MPLEGEACKVFCRVAASVNVPGEALVTEKAGVGGRWRSEKSIFVALILLSLIPIVLFEHFPSEDTPLHVASAAVYLNTDSPLVEEYYQVDSLLAPNVLGDLVLAGLLSFLSAAAAVKVMIIALALGLPLALRWCLSTVSPSMSWLAILAIPLSNGRSLYMGYLNFQLAVVVGLVAFAFWNGHLRGERGTPSRWALLVVLLTLTLLSHPLPFLAVFLLVFAVAVNEGRSSGSATRTLGGFALAGALPLALMLVSGGGMDTSLVYSQGLVDRAVRLPFFLVYALSAYEVPLGVLSTAAIALVAVIALISPKERRWESPGFLMASALLFAIFFGAPDGIGNGADVVPRVALYFFIVVLLWVAGRTLPDWARKTSIACAAVVVLALAVVRIPSHQVLDEDIREYLSGEQVVVAGSTVLPLWLTDLEEGRGPGGSVRLVQPLVERVGDLTVSGGVIDLHHLVGSLDINPFRFRPGLDIRLTPAEHVGYPFQFGPGMVDIGRFEAMGEAQVDYVWLWGRAHLDPSLLESEQARSMLEQIEEGFELVFTSEPRGMLEVYVRRADR